MNAFRLADIAALTGAPVSLMASPAALNSVLTRGKPIQLFTLGECRTVDGRKVKCTQEDIDLVLRDLATRQNPVPLTYEHGEDPVMGDLAAGECTSFYGDDKGLWAEAPAWTDQAVEQIRSGQRTWISPTFYAITDADGNLRPRVIRDNTLCSVPNIDGMRRVEVTATKPVTTSAEPDTKGANMSLTANSLKLLGLADNAKPEDIEAAIVAMGASNFPAGKPRSGIQQCTKCAAPLKCAACSAHAPLFVEPDEDNLNRGDDPATDAGKKKPGYPGTTKGTALMSYSPDAIADRVVAKMAASVEAQVQAKEHAAKVAAIVAKADTDGKLYEKNRRGFEAFAAADPAGAEALLATMAVVTPTKRTVSTGPTRVELKAAVAAPGEKKTDEQYAAESEELTLISQYAAKHGVSIKQARAALVTN